MYRLVGVAGEVCGPSSVLKLMKSALPESGDRASLQEAFESEALALVACAGHGVPRLLATLTIEGCPSLVMSEAAGIPLSLAAANQPAEYRKWSTVQRLLLELCAILARIHAAGWLHCDLNPGNIIIGASSLSLVDFGGAMHRDRKPRWRYPMGRHRYMGPEHLLGRHDPVPFARVGPWSDVHQVACLTAWLLVGARAFREPRPDEAYRSDYLDALGEWMLQPVAEKMSLLAVEDRLACTPRGLDDLLAACLEPVASQRVQTVVELRRRLARLEVAS